MGEMEKVLSTPDFNSIDSIRNSSDSQPLLRGIAVDRGASPAARVMAMKLLCRGAASHRTLLRVMSRGGEDPAIAHFSEQMLSTLLMPPKLGWARDHSLYEFVFLSEKYPSGKSACLEFGKRQDALLGLVMDSDGSFIARAMAVILLNDDKKRGVSVAEPTRTREDELIKRFAAAQLETGQEII